MTTQKNAASENHRELETHHDSYRAGKETSHWLGRIHWSLSIFFWRVARGYRRLPMTSGEVGCNQKIDHKRNSE